MAVDVFTDDIQQTRLIKIKRQVAVYERYILYLRINESRTVDKVFFDNLIGALEDGFICMEEFAEALDLPYYNDLIGYL